MTSFSLGTVWEDTVAYIRRESGLLIPVALAIFMPAQLLLSYAMQGMDPTGSGARGAHNLLIIPTLLLVLFGNVTISLIVLTPGISVREAMSRSLGRFPVTVATMLILMVGFFLCVVLAAIVGSVLAVAGGGGNLAGLATTLASILTIPLLFLVVRLLLMWAVLAVEGLGAADSIRRSWALAHGRMLRFAAIFLLMMMSAMLIAVLDQLVLGSIAKLLALALGEPELLFTIQMVASAAIESVLSMAVSVFLAFTYARVTAAG